MKTIRQYGNFVLAAASLMVLGACAGMSQQDKSTAVGVDVIGHEVGKDKK